jgi:predicted Ser/Thr protein kinase
MDDWDRLRKIGEKAMAGRLERLTAAGRLGKFRLLRRLGEGAMGEVWLAEDETRGGPVALKILTALRESDRERFAREASLAAQLDHPRIVKVHESGEIEGHAYIAMQYIPGAPLESKIADPKEAARLVAEIADAIQCAHDRGVIHRDIKPDNLIRTENGQIYLADFGLARQDQSPTVSTSQSGVILGTPAFISPELARGHPGDATAQSDIYSLGATLYFLVGGKIPFPGENIYEVLAKVIDADPEPLDIDRPLQKIMAQAMAKDPSRRYASAKALAEDLRRYTRGERVWARPPIRISRRWWFVAAAAVLAPLTFGTWMWIDRERTADELRGALRSALEARRRGENHALPGLLTVMDAAYSKLPDSAEYEFLMGRMHRLMMNDSVALKHQERALALDSNYAPSKYEQSVLLVRLDRAPPPEDEKQLFADPAREEAWEMLTRISLRKSAWDEAIERASNGISHDAGYVPHFVHRAHAYLERASAKLNVGVYVASDFVAAESDLSHALRLEPKHVPAIIGRAMVRTKRSDRSGNVLGDLGLAENDCNEALRLEPDNPDAFLWRGIARTNRGTTRARLNQDPAKDYEMAIEDISEALKRRSIHPESWVKRAIARNNLALWRRAFGHGVKSYLEAALKDVNEAVQLESDNASALVARAMIRTQFYQSNSNLAELDMADRDLDMVLKYEPQSADAWMRRGHIRWHRAQRWESLKKADEAALEYRSTIKEYERALGINAFLAPSIEPRLAEARKKISE